MSATVRRAFNNENSQLSAKAASGQTLRFRFVIEFFRPTEGVYHLSLVSRKKPSGEILLAISLFILHVECSGTFFRQASPFANYKTRIVVSADELHGKIEINWTMVTPSFESGAAIFCLLARGVFEIESSDRTGKLFPPLNKRMTSGEK